MSMRKFVSSLALLMFLGACATGDNAGSYDAAFEDSQKASKEQNLEDYKVASLSPGKRPPLNSDEAGLWMIMDRAERHGRATTLPPPGPHAVDRRSRCCSPAASRSPRFDRR